MYDKRQKVMVHRDDLKNVQNIIGWQKVRDNSIRGEWVIMWLTNGQINNLARKGVWVEQ
jgi:hypothetical protein